MQPSEEHTSADNVSPSVCVVCSFTLNHEWPCVTALEFAQQFGPRHLAHPQRLFTAKHAALARSDGVLAMDSAKKRSENPQCMDGFVRAIEHEVRRVEIDA